ncbi:MAG: acyl carrier protein [Chitinispirillaceae bacterium]|nr:acyl carrier protein [Chitinispirillaceae bacterium]
MNCERKVVELIRSNIEKKYAVTPKSDLREDLEVDSFGTIMIVNAIEDEFNIVVEEQDIKTMVRVSDIVNLLEQKYLTPVTPSHDA